jgi:quercetin dioxygenase-like cupin family protein
MALVTHDQYKAKQVEPGLFGLKLIDGAMGSQHVSLLRGWLRPGARHSPHTHDVEEAVVFLGGTGIVEIGAQRHEVGPGDAIHIPPGVLHSTDNTGSEDLWFVAAYPDNEITANIGGSTTDHLKSQDSQRAAWRNRLAWVLRRIADRLSPRR